jgi:universal stress protein A
MYSHILVAVEHTAADGAILTHAQDLARLAGSRMTLVHVADGWVARNYDALALRESDEIKSDREYLERLVAEIQANGIPADGRLAMGDPATEILRVADQEQVDLIAMATHGHRFLADVLKGATADRVRHLARVPVLMVRHESGR